MGQRHRAGYSHDSDEEEQNIITRMNLLSKDFEQDTRPWGDQVVGRVTKPR